MREILYTGLGAVFSRMSLSEVRKFGNILGTFFWFILPGRRTMAIRTIVARLGVTKQRAKNIARKNFVHTAQAFGEIFFTRQVDHAFVRDHLEILNPEILTQLAHIRRPVVTVTGHLGAWELLAGICQPLLADDQPTMVIVRQPRDKALGKLMMHLRSVGRLKVVPHRNAARKVLRCLKKGGMAAFLVDHNCSRSEALFLPFLGKTAAVNMGPALLALRANAYVLPVFLVRNEDATYTLEILSPLDTATLEGTREEKVRAITIFYTQAVETMVKNYPEQWFWMHKRWKTRPESEEKQ